MGKHHRHRILRPSSHCYNLLTTTALVLLVLILNQNFSKNGVGVESFSVKMINSLSLLSVSSSKLKEKRIQQQQQSFHHLKAHYQNHHNQEKDECQKITTTNNNRRWFLSSLFFTAMTTTMTTTTTTTAFAEDNNNNNNNNPSSYESIAAKAARISKSIELEEKENQQNQKPLSIPSTSSSTSSMKTAYDFVLPMEGENISFGNIIHQQKLQIQGNNKNNNEVEEENNYDYKVKAILVVNIKQDDPLARRDIAELISLASRYGRNGEFVVLSSPTDQGYFEPDTSALIRLKLASEYGYGINPSTIITDKMNLLGTGAHPFWRWLEGNCRTPDGLGRIQANFEKFLIDGRTGLPLRRYPRKYAPLDISDDIEALLQQNKKGGNNGSGGKSLLPPPRGYWREEWRMALKDAERDTYRFQKGLNVFDE